MKFDINTIIAIITALTSLGAFAVIRSIVKETKQAIAKYKAAQEDGVITREEMEAIAKESFDAIEEIIKLGYIIKKVLKKKK